MIEGLCEWCPTEAEVRRIVDELRPIIREFTDREQFRIAVTTAIEHFS